MNFDRIIDFFGFEGVSFLVIMVGVCLFIAIIQMVLHNRRKRRYQGLEGMIKALDDILDSLRRLRKSLTRNIYYKSANARRNKRIKKLRKYIRTNPNVTYEQMLDHVGLSNPRHIHNYLRELQASGHELPLPVLAKFKNYEQKLQGALK